MKNHAQNLTRRSIAIGVIGIIIGLVMALAGPANAATQWWDPGIGGGTQGTLTNAGWSAFSNAWASVSTGTTIPGTWTNGNDAVFPALGSAYAGVTATVFEVSANSVTFGPGAVSSKWFLQPGFGALTNGAGGITVALNDCYPTIYCDVSLSATQSWFVYGGSTLAVTGLVSGANAAIIKTGNGPLTLANPGDSFGGLILNNGTVEATGTNQIFGSTVTFATTVASNASTVAAATLIIDGWTKNTTTTVNNVTVSGAGGVLQLTDPSANVTNTLLGGALTRTSPGTLIVTPASGLGVREQVYFTSGTNLVNGILAPWLVTSLNSGDFVSNGATGLTNAKYATSFNSAMTTQVVSLASATSLAAMQTSYAVKVSAALNLNGNNLTVGDGTTAGMIFNNGMITNGGAAAVLNVGSAEAPIYVPSANSGTIAVGVTGTGTLTLFGAGTLVISNANLWPGTVNVNGGSLVLSPTADLLYTNAINCAGSLLKGGGSNLTLTNGYLVGGNVTVNAGTLTLGGGTSAVSAVTFGGNNAGLTLSNGAVVIPYNGMAIGGNGNTFTVTGTGSMYSNSNTSISLNGNGARMVIAAGGKVVDSSNCYIGSGATTSNSVLVTGNGSSWSNVVYGAGQTEIAIGGSSGGWNSLVVSNGGYVFNLNQSGGQSIYIGLGGGGTNSLLVTGNGSVVSNSGAVYAGYTSGSNNVIVADGGKLAVATSMTLGNTATGHSNLLSVGSAGLPSTVWVGGALVIGSVSGYNTMLITNATVISNAGTIGNSSASNTVTISSNGMWNLAGGALNVGSVTGYGNTLTVYGGGAVSNVATLSLGGLASNNMLVTDGGLLWVTSAGIGKSNTLTVTGTGSVFRMTSASGVSVSGDGLLVISNGARAILAGSLGPNGFNSRTIITGPGTVVSNSSTLWLGLQSSSNYVTIADQAVAVFASTVIGAGGGQVYTGNTLTVTGGASLTNTTSTGLYMGDTGSAIGGVVTVSNGGKIINTAGGTSFGGTGVNSSNNSITVTGVGSVYSNNGALTVGSAAQGNSLTVADGGIFINTSGVIGGSNSGSNNTVTVTDPGSAWTNSTTLVLGNAALMYGNRVVVTNRGTAVIGTTLTVGGNATATSNGVFVADGGVLQANSLVIGAGTTGNTISNSGGVYQFTNSSPVITSLTAGDIAIDNGTISFRSTSTADVTNNLGNGALKGIRFAGANTFMLNAASNTTAGQAYTFAATASPSNYVNLAMINGQTAYRGGGVTIDATGSLLASNTTASFTDVVTNQGVAVLLNGSATFTGGLYNQGTVTNKDNTFNGSLTMNNGTFVTAGSAAQTLSGAVSLPGNGTFDTGVSLTLAAGASGVGAITKLGASDLVLPTANTFSGDTRPVAGAVVLGNSYAVSNSTVNLAGGDTGSLVFSNNGAYTLGGLKGDSGRTLALTGSDSLPVALTVGNNGQNTEFGGSISGSGSLTKVGAGVLVLSGANSYNGDTYISAGQLVLANAAAAINSAVTVTYNNALAFSNVTTTAIAGLTGSGNLVLNNVNGGSGIGLTVSNANNNLTYSGVMSGSGSLTKAGNATLELTGNNTFNGTVGVSAGMLLVNGSLAGGGPLSLSAGATLGGSGTVGRVVGGAGQVAPGNSPGLLTVNQLDPSGGTGFEFEFTQLSPNFGNLGAIGNDVLRITNATPFTVALGLSNTVNLVVTAPLTAGVINYLRGGFYSDSGAMFDPTINGATYNLFIDDGGPLAFVHTVAETTPWGTGRILEIGVWGKMIPEPQVVMFWLTGAATLYAARRRMRRQK